MRYFLASLLLFTLASCSSAPISRVPAQESACTDIVKNFFITKTYEKDLNKVLAQKNLITFTEKKAMIHYPSLEWINKVKRYFNTSLRNWNNNRYPSFYLFNKEEILPTAKRYSENLEKILSNTVPLDDEQTTKAFVDVSDWIKSYKNYDTELDQLIEERISLQYNISLLKDLELNSNKPRDIQLAIKRGGELKSEVITLRKGDDNLKATINKLKAEMSELDGSLISNGKIKERIIRQAMLLDMLSILHRELEYVVKNSAAPSEEMLAELKNLSLLIKNKKLAPSTYGVYKIDNKIFMRELITTAKLDKAYALIEDPLNKLKTILSDYFKNKNAGTEKEKIGFLKRIYAKITKITPKQAALGGGSTIVAGIGFERYFAFKDKEVKEVDEDLPSNELEPADLAHKEQLEHTQKVETEKHADQSSVVEIPIEELTK